MNAYHGRYRMAGLIARLRGARTTVLTVAGFSGLTASAGIAFGLAAGIAVGSLACFAIEYLSDDEKGGTS